MKKMILLVVLLITLCGGSQNNQKSSVADDRLQNEELSVNEDKMQQTRNMSDITSDLIKESEAFQQCESIVINDMKNLTINEINDTMYKPIHELKFISPNVARPIVNGNGKCQRPIIAHTTYSAEPITVFYGIAGWSSAPSAYTEYIIPSENIIDWSYAD